MKKTTSRGEAAWRITTINGHPLSDFRLNGNPIPVETEANRSTMHDAEWRAWGYLWRLVEAKERPDILTKTYADYSVEWEDWETTRPEWVVFAAITYLNDETKEVFRKTIDYAHGVLKHDEIGEDQRTWLVFPLNVWRVEKVGGRTLPELGLPAEGPECRSTLNEAKCRAFRIAESAKASAEVELRHDGTGEVVHRALRSEYGVNDTPDDEKPVWRVVGIVGTSSQMILEQEGKRSTREDAHWRAAKYFTQLEKAQRDEIPKEKKEWGTTLPVWTVRAEAILRNDETGKEYVEEVEYSETVFTESTREAEMSEELEP